jgi:pilus assembly protein Flp/PilA
MKRQHEFCIEPVRNEFPALARPGDPTKDLCRSGRTAPHAPFGAGNNARNNASYARFLHDESGATAIEYGLIVAGISIAIAGVLNAVGSGLNATFNTLIADLASARK